LIVDTGAINNNISPVKLDELWEAISKSSFVRIIEDFHGFYVFGKESDSTSRNLTRLTDLPAFDYPFFVQSVEFS
jgi:hypothetical protein